MKVYFYGNIHSTSHMQRRFASIISIFENNGIQVLSNIKTGKVSLPELEKLTQAGESLMEKIYALIIEGTNQSFETAHLIALALTHKRPVLYLIEEGRYIDKNLSKLENDPKTRHYFKVEFYTHENINAILKNFIEGVEKSGKVIQEKPMIKFTLRVTPTLEKYLYWKTHNTNISKADFLREEIQKMMEQDEEFRKFLEEG